MRTKFFGNIEIMETIVKTPEIRAELARGRFDNLVKTFQKNGEVSVKVDNAF